MEKIYNLTQHELTEQQINHLSERFQLEIIEDSELEILKQKLSNLSGEESLFQLMNNYANLFKHGIKNGVSAFMMSIGSPLALLVCGNILTDMIPFETEKKFEIKLFFSSTLREVVEEKLPNGSIKKTQEFKHLGFNVLGIERDMNDVSWSLDYFPL